MRSVCNAGTHALDQLQGGNVVFDRGTVGEDVPQIDERVIENLVTRRGPACVPGGAGIPGREWEARGDIREVREERLEVLLPELARVQLHGVPHMGEFKNAHGVDEIQNQRPGPDPGTSTRRQDCLDVVEPLGRTFQDPPPLALQSPTPVPAPRRLADPTA